MKHMKDARRLTSVWLSFCVECLLISRRRQRLTQTSTKMVKFANTIRATGRASPYLNTCEPIQQLMESKEGSGGGLQMRTESAAMEAKLIGSQRDLQCTTGILLAVCVELTPAQEGRFPPEVAEVGGHNFHKQQDSFHQHPQERSKDKVVKDCSRSYTRPMVRCPVYSGQNHYPREEERYRQLKHHLLRVGFPQFPARVPISQTGVSRIVPEFTRCLILLLFLRLNLARGFKHGDNFAATEVFDLLTVYQELSSG
ncbi:hypothetical protein PoB_006963200 [Plakobranchus ocellatus]|uniref:Uncharacterized protein n=1 Tax=Plakobranchus ocellatus TaxID=259542 RepID=A0AAV4DFX6_9GAST|nr:hypothetical protein PoB_006963200 [Plakobranchus ocellatus]